MEFIVNRETVLPALNKVTGVVDRRQTLPILGHLLVVARDGRVSLTGTDLEVEVKTSFEAEILQEGETTIPARKLFDICRQLSEGAEIRFRLRDERCVITAGRGRFTLGQLPATDFPIMDLPADGFDFQIQEGQLKHVLDKTAFAMAQQDVRYYLNGLLLELKADALIAVATDGHRLAKFVTPLDLALDTERQGIVPSKTVMELKRQLGGSDAPVALRLSERSLRVVVGTMTLTSKLIDGRYPDYERVIPGRDGGMAIVEKDALRRALSRVSIFSNEKYRAVRLDFEPGRLKLLAHNPEQEEAEEEIELDYAGEPISIGFNVAYLMDVLGAIDAPAVSLYFQDANSSSLWRGADSESETFVVMPMRL
ncbi:DNA polymerase III subunit beta [Thermochromatium tepidum]|uniref:Beta sliding clamp n=1 Tax=Thermochromatium tepidum ATCC 43061 TaxID=316276 RepID=A0A6I6E482_THETI|nr:DNA polymerase III subunit beta [Thermochromatium tepidum]QGU33765.1 DNA polymerase III subunit beta [Thermochromatium tepidum ATCC 43061]